MSETISAGAPIGNKNAAGKGGGLTMAQNSAFLRAGRASQRAQSMSQDADHENTEGAHGEAAELHWEAAQAHKEARDSHGKGSTSWKEANDKVKHHESIMKEHDFKSKSAAKATDTESSDVVRAAGTSEGSMKGWEARRLSHQAGQASAHAAKHGDSFSHGLAEKSHEKAAKTHEEAAGEKGIGFDEANEHRANCIFHETLAKAHKEIQKSLPYAGKNASDIMNKASDTTNTEVVHCRSHSASGPVLATDKPWSAGEVVQIMWMPAGTHTICAGFRRGSIELTVNCDATTADAVQASLEAWRQERPRQEPFGCIEHKEQEASFRVGASCGFKWNNDGVYLAAEPTTLGAQNVNGKVHRSWSPSFTTDADYSKATEHNGVLMFPEGVRGSRSNPAQITGVDFCVGTLTNKPAFHAMSPVKAKDAVQAAGTSEGAKKAAQTRKEHSNEHGTGYVRPSGDKFYASTDHRALGVKNTLHDTHEAAVGAMMERLTESGGEKAKATDTKPTPDTILANHQAKLEAANRIAAAQGALKVSVEDVYEKCAVTATGTSEGAKKGWEKKKFHVTDDDGVLSGHDDVHEALAAAEDRATKTGRQHTVRLNDFKNEPGSGTAIHLTGHGLHGGAKATDATPQDILNRIYARAGENR